MKLTELPIHKVRGGYTSVHLPSVPRVDAVFLEAIYSGRQWTSEQILTIVTLWDQTVLRITPVDGDGSNAASKIVKQAQQILDAL